MTVESQVAGLHSRMLEALPVKLARVKSDVVFQLAGRVLTVTDGQIEEQSGIVMALTRIAAEAMTSAERISEQRVSVQAALSTTSLQQVRERLRGQLQDLESDPARLTGDLVAVNRWLDHEAIDDRLAAALADHVDRVELAYMVADALLQQTPGGMEGLDVRTVIDVAFDHVGRASAEAIAVRALSLVTTVLSRSASGNRLGVLGVNPLRSAVSLLKAQDERIWIRVAALELLSTALPGKDALELLSSVLSGHDRRGSRDGMLLRHRAVLQLRDLDCTMHRRLKVLREAATDPSEHVRQGVALVLASLASFEAKQELSRICQEDGSARVAAYAIIQLAQAAEGDHEAGAAFERVALELLEQGSGPTPPAALTLRVLLRALEQLARSEERWFSHERTARKLSRMLQSVNLPVTVSTEAASTLLNLEVFSDAAKRGIRREFADALSDLSRDESTIVDFSCRTTLEDLEKSLFVACSNDLPVALRSLGDRRFVLTRGEKRRFRTWRFLFETRNPAPDKRQPFNHSLGRSWRGEITTAPLTMAEVTKTRVPGERRVLPGESTWGHFLPLVDDLLFACGLTRHTHRVVTVFGTIHVKAPSRLWQRLWARIHLTLRYFSFCGLREASLDARAPSARRGFVVAVEALGFSVGFENHTSRIDSVDLDRVPPRVRACYSLALLPAWAERLFNDALSATGNTVWHLAVVVWIVFAVMVIRAAHIRQRIDALRQSIPLCVGGWGSRGKSGTERLKAALFHAFRLEVVVKTTGCEAMIIHARRDLPARELFVYRPYDRATIWEQVKLLEAAQSLKAQVFLWECMALRPEFARILQQEWMRDDITTITNAYPDHEDVMGPSGEDVARVIGSFAGRRATVFTSETQMLPLLRDETRRNESEFFSVSELDAALLPKDLLERFPYSEHPGNIALVLRLAEHLGLRRDWALSKMADHVVADLGVLKTYPTAECRGRRLTFSNGMSANERAGFLSNWSRLGFDDLSPDRKPSQFIVAVVNNRADRVARSRVFADLLIQDKVPDRLVLIGTNLASLERMLSRALSDWLSQQEPEADDPEGSVDAILRHLRFTTNADTLTERLRRTLTEGGASTATLERALHPTEGLAFSDACFEQLRESWEAAPGVDSVARDDALQSCRVLVDEYRDICALKRQMLQREAAGALSAEEQQRLLVAFKKRVSVVRDSNATGDQVVHHVAGVIPFGHHARILGCQNIKGTGLDFVYRWVSLEQVVLALEQLTRQPSTRTETLNWLNTHGDYGVLDAELALRTVKSLRVDEGKDWARHQTRLARLETHLQSLLDVLRKRLEGTRRRGILAPILGAVEPWVDHLDSIRRQRRSRLIMEDLFAQRIGQGRAAQLLRELVARGKGGWLASDVARAMTRTHQDE